MNRTLTLASLALTSAAFLAFTGCGGGSDSAPVAAVVPVTAVVVPDVPVASAAVTFTGTVATGAAFVGAIITVVDSRGILVATSAPVGASGAYTVTLASGAVAPFVIIAARTAADGTVESMVSVAESASVTTLNVTPITTLIASRLSPSGDPLKLVSELTAGTARVTAATVAATVAEVKQILGPVLSATGTLGVDPLTGSFAVDGNGYDRLLDSIRINFVPASATLTNIEIGIKISSSGDGSASPVIQLTNGQSVAAITTTNNITASSIGSTIVTSSGLVAPGTSVLISSFLENLTSCYALPLSSRVSGVTGTATAVVGTASAVIAPECKTVFHNADPSTFLSNGNKVGRNSSNAGAFSSLFRNGATGVVFSQGAYEFTRTNGDLVISYKSRDATGAEAFDSLVVRKEDDGKLRLIGNQYAYPGSVSAYHQLRQFITLGQGNANYYSSGYTLNVDNLQNGANPMFNRVEVTMPIGGSITLYPNAGVSLLAFKKSGVVTSTNFLRLASSFAAPALTSSPSTFDSTSLFFASPQRTDAELSSVAQQSVWTFKYFLFGNTGTTPDAVQSYKTRARALTMGELKLKGFAALVPAVVSDIAIEANALTGVINLSPNETLKIDNNGGEAWSVPAGALPPTNIKVFGRTGSNSPFDDTSNFASTVRQTTVACTAASVSDFHCSSTVTGAYAAGSSINGLHLFSRDQDGREYANFYAMYKLAVLP